MTDKTDIMRGTIPQAGNVPFLFGIARAVALPGPILTGLLIELGMTEPAARTLLSRLRRAESLDVTHHGRVAVYRLAGRMATAFRRLRRGPAPGEWDGRFHTVIFDVAETERGFKDRLRYAATNLGYGQLRSGLLIHARDRWEALATTVGDPPDEALVEHGRLTVAPQAAQRIAGRAWDLPTRADQLDAAARRIETLLREPIPGDGTESLRLMHRTGSRSLALRLADPDLPAELLPDGWAGPRLHRALHRLTERLIPTVGHHVRTIIEASSHRDLVEYESTADG